MHSTHELTSKTRTLTLSQDELAGIMQAIGFRKADDSSAGGLASLGQRELVFTDGEEPRPSDDLRAFLGPFFFPDSTLSLVGSTGEFKTYYLRDGYSVAGQAEEDGILRVEKYPLEILAQSLANALAEMRGSDLTDVSAIGELQDLLKDLGVGEYGNLSFLGLVQIRQTDTHRLAFVLRHSAGYIWLDPGNSATVGSCDSASELSEFVTSMIASSRLTE